MAEANQKNQIETQSHITVRSFSQCRNQILATAIVTIGSFGTGTVFGWSAVATDDLLNSGDFKTLTNKKEISWITSLAILGAFLAGPIAGISMDKIGRKKSIIVFSFPFMLGWAIMSSAYFLKDEYEGVYLLYVGRLLTGFCAGSNLVVIPSYIKEITSDSMRGILGSAMPLTLCLGMLYTFIIGAYLNWPILSVVCGFAPLLQVIFILIIPETPRYLMTQNRREESIYSYKWLNRIGTYELAEEGLELFVSTASANSDNVKTCRWEKLTRRPVLCPILIIFCVVFFQQSSGVNSVTLYTIQIFRDAGNFLPPHAATMILGVVQVVFVAVSMFLVDILGRKTLLVSCNLIMFFSLAGLGYFFFMKENGDKNAENLSWLPVFTIYTYMASYSCGVGSVPWLLASEIHNPEFRAESSTIMTSAYWIFGFLVAKSFERLRSWFKDSGTFWLYAAFCLCGALYCLVFVPETKGKTSDEILQLFGGNTDTNPNANESICEESGQFISPNHDVNNQLKTSSDKNSKTELSNTNGKSKTVLQ